MPPQEPYLPPPQSAAPPPQQNYDFIMNPQQPKRGFGGNFFDGSPKSLIILLGGVVAFFIVIFIVYQATKPASIVPQLTKLAQSQNEMVRVAGLNPDDLNSSSARAIAANIGVVIGSQQTQFLSFLSENGVEISGKDIALGEDKTTDQRLELASQNGDYDSTFTQIMSAELKNYDAQLASVYKKTKGASLKQILSDDYHDVGLLLEQVR